MDNTNAFDICFLSILYPAGISEYDRQIKFQRAQNITSIQNSIIEGLQSANKTKPWVINTLLSPLFPRGYSSPIVREMPMEHGVNHAYINLPFLYSSSLFYGAKKHIKKWAKQETEKEKLIIAYSLTTYTLQAMQYVKKINPKIKTAIIVPDLPQFTYRETAKRLTNMKNKLGKAKVLHVIDKFSPYVDGWILFSEKMTERLPCCKDYMVFEGVATDIFCHIEPKRLTGDEKYVILYAGGLNKNYGVQLLIDSFKQLKDDCYHLLLAGRGELQSEIKQVAKSDKRIQYLGEIERQTLLSLEAGADLLINPRVDSEIFTRYSFPSKNMEYLSSGTPVLGYKLEGIPDEYDEHINYFSEPSVESIVKAITEMARKKSEMKQKAELSKNFILENKNKYVWGNKILEFAKRI